jgi:hypothetical protein
VAAVLGGLLAVTVRRRLQRRAAALTALLAVGFDLLFFVVSELPATVPVGLSLLILLATRRLRLPGGSRFSGSGERGVPEHGPADRAPPAAAPAAVGPVSQQGSAARRPAAP